MVVQGSFFETSKVIANKFLQNIVFVDDRAFLAEEDKNDHDFNASEISSAFAKSEKICAVYKPEELTDIDDLSQISKKADIAVLDWQINIKGDLEGDLEEEVEEEDPRGPHTKKIIREILSDPITGRGSLKLILIYTGETDLPGIADEIYQDLQREGIEDIQKRDCEVYTANIRILVIAKSVAEEGDKFKYNPELKERIVSYEELPDFMLTEFTKMTSGLLTNFVLKSLTVLRENSFRLIKLYNKELDPSFLNHRLLLSDQEDSKEHLVEILSNSFQGLLNYNDVAECISNISIGDWIDQFELNDSINVSNQEIELNNEFLKKLYSDGVEISLEKLWADKEYGQVPNNIFSKFTEKIYKKGSSYLVDADNNEKQDSEFSILTHHKSNLKQPSNSPKLSLGSIIKQEDNGKYFLCIQAKCDSVRVEEERKFLFLPLLVCENQKFKFVIEDGDSFVKLKPAKEVYELRTIKFHPKDGEKSVLAESDDSNLFCFTSSYGEKFFWICDLKDAHAQRETNLHAAQISRVGLAESEWLRRSS